MAGWEHLLPQPCVPTSGVCVDGESQVVPRQPQHTPTVTRSLM